MLVEFRHHHGDVLSLIEHDIVLSLRCGKFRSPLRCFDVSYVDDFMVPVFDSDAYLCVAKLAKATEIVAGCCRRFFLLTCNMKLGKPTRTQRAQ